MKTPCPSCGGAGGGPFGRAGGAWDTEDYVCPRCAGAGVIDLDDARPLARPGIAKAQGESSVVVPAKKPRAIGS